MDFINDLNVNGHKIINVQYLQGLAESSNKVVHKLIIESFSPKNGRTSVSFDGSNDETIHLLEEVKNLINQSGAITSIIDPITALSLKPNGDGVLATTLNGKCIFDSDSDVDSFVASDGKNGVNIPNGLLIVVLKSSLSKYSYNKDGEVVETNYEDSVIKIYDKSNHKFIPLSLTERLKSLLGAQYAERTQYFSDLIHTQYTATSQWIQGVQGTLIKTVQEVQRLGKEDTFWARLVNECANHGIRIANGVIGTQMIQGTSFANFSAITNADKVEEPK